MPNERWATIIAVSTVIIMRIVDVVLPKGYVSKWVNKYLMKKPPDDKA